MNFINRIKKIGYRKKFKREGLLKQGFSGFISVNDLRDGNITVIPKENGVYVVLREDKTVPDFLDKSVGGWYKGTDPTERIDKLQSKWVPGSHTIYIGKGTGSSGGLQRRIKELLDFGSGKKVAHRGGRYIWQIENSDEFIISWKTTELDKHAEDLESKMLNRFIKGYGCLPFANLRRS